MSVANIKTKLLSYACFTALMGINSLLPAATAAEAPEVSNQPSYSTTATATPERKCRTPVRSMMEKLQSDERFAAAAKRTNKTFPPVNRPLTIPVQFHVIYKKDSAGNEVGNVPASKITQQITVLNNAYQGSGFKFSLAGINRVQNTSWFDGCMDDESLEATYKQTLAVDPAHTLNAYTCQSIDGLLGFATFPDMYDETDYMHGVVLEYRSLPGNKAPYGAGDTATHEIGHYLGLYHTFDDNRSSCTTDNDLVSDTAIERTPTFGCPLKQDTCTTQVGKDPSVNFMDYSDDACMTSFSIGQIKRMQQQVTAFKPSLIP